MRKLIVSEFISLDGVVEDPGGVEGFERGGWTSAYLNDELAAYKRDEPFSADALLLGRVTYEGFAASWPDASHEAGEYADRMNSLPRHVVSSTLTDLTWNNSHALGGRPREGDRAAHGASRPGSAGLRQRSARADPDAARSRRQPAPAGLPGHRGPRPTSVRRDRRRHDLRAGGSHDARLRRAAPLPRRLAHLAPIGARQTFHRLAPTTRRRQGDG